MDNEIKQATRLLQAQRESLRDEQPLGWLRNRFSSPAATDYTYKEINKVLSEVIESDGSVGVVRALLDLGADVNFVRRRNSTTWSKIAQRQQPGERSNLLLRATVRCRPETVHLLAARADQHNLDSVLHHAIVRGDMAVLRTLLEHGASPVLLHDDFQNAVFHNKVELIQALLSGHHLPCLACRSAGLRLAVHNRSMEVIHLLLSHWADVNYQNASALLEAVEIRRPDFVAALISGSVSASPRSLDAAIGKLQGSIEEEGHILGREMLELCLAAGARGPETIRLTSSGFVEMITRRQIHLLDTVLRHRRVSEDYDGVALAEAIRTEQLDIIIKLLAFEPSARSLTMAMSQALVMSNTELQYEVAQALIEAGAQGSCTEDALVKIVHCVVSDSQRGDDSALARDMRIFRLLLVDGKAEINYRKGEALQIAVRASCKEVAEEIVSRVPSPESLGAALPWAMEISNTDEKQIMVQIVLRHQISDKAVGKALVDAFRSEPENTRLIQLLLTRASVNYNNGEVFVYAVRSFRPETFHLLLNQGISYKALFTALLESLEAPRPNRRVILRELFGRFQLDHLNTALKHVVLEAKPDLALIKTILESGAEAAHEDGVCIKNAACNLDRDLLSLLAQYTGKNKELFTCAFVTIISRDRKWISFEHVEVIRILLQHGASSQVASRAMIEVVDCLACKEDNADLARILLDVLFSFGADVDHENGKALGLAASRGDPVLLSSLLDRRPDSGSTTLALFAAIMAHHEETLLLELLDVMGHSRTAVTDFNRSLPGMPQSPIILCLKGFGHSVAILDSLVRGGCRLDSTISMELCRYTRKSGEDRLSSEIEPVSVLMWALLQEDGVIGVEVVEALIRHGADVSYTSPSSGTTPLLVAVKARRVDLVELLLDNGAKISVKDSRGRSALFFAAREGDFATLALLLKHTEKPATNDGSLHEAARGFHTAAMKLLLGAGHDPNFRSTRHGGRTALGEIAFKADTPDDIGVAEEAIDLLSSVDASPLLKVNGKTVIFMALDNQNNEAITRLLLDRLLYRTLNSHENTYQQGVYHYSPTMYVSKGILLGPQSESLLQMLREHGCEDRYYATMEEEQPVDAVGLPEEIREYERERRLWEQHNRRVEEIHANEIRRETEKAHAVAHIEDLTHSRSLRHREEASQQQRRHRGLDHQQAIMTKAVTHHNDSNIRVSEANVNSRVRWQRHNDDMAMVGQKRDAGLGHRQQVHLHHIEERKNHEQLNGEFRELRHARSLAQMQTTHRQRWDEKENFNLQQLEFDRRKRLQDFSHGQKKRQLDRELMYEGDQMAAQRQMRERSQAQERHDMHMTELRTQRGNIIGQVNLEELRRWQQSERGMAGIGGAPRAQRLLA
ncbi:hypothetical protein QBC43DRAFT_49554 [Cladorrhinum sp. PSN259]|nr:hypothetical protein QBC43DRAFT_49554 [Cladorrhinum sp. PSN259]